MERYAIVGFGCAGYHGAKALRDSGYTGEIHVYTNESKAPANPMLTTYVAGGKLDEKDAFPFGNLQDIAGVLDLDVHVERIQKVYAKEKKIESEQGTVMTFDKILIATGADAFVPNMEGKDNKRVFVMRTMEDSRKLKDYLEENDVRSAVVVGASMAGIKVAELFVNMGIHCVLNDFAPHVFSLAALDPIADEIERRVTAKGVELVFGTGISRVLEKEDKIAVELTDKRAYGCDLLVLCIGTRAATGILDDEIQVNRGILVDTSMQTSAEGIYAAGDCTEGRNMQTGQSQIIGLWANAANQGRCAGCNMAGVSTEYEGNIIHNITHFMDMDFVSFGDKSLPGELVVFENRNPELMLAATVHDGEFACVNILGSYENTGIIKNIMMKRIRGIKAELDPFMKAKLEQQGIDPKFIKLLGGVKE